MSEEKAPEKKTSYVNAVFRTPMSLKDQIDGMNLASYVLYATGGISFVVAYYLNRFIICVYAVIGVALLLAALYLPNWRLRKDSAADVVGTELEGKAIMGTIGEWVSPTETEAFYGQLMEMRDAISGSLRSEAGVVVAGAGASEKKAKSK